MSTNWGKNNLTLTFALSMASFHFVYSLTPTTSVNAVTKIPYSFTYTRINAPGSFVA